MYEYEIIYTCGDGCVGRETVMAANRTMAFMMFEELGIENVVSANCYRVLEEEEED